MKETGGGGGCSGGDGSNDGGDDDDDGDGGGNEDGNGDGDRRRLMDAMVKVCPCWLRMETNYVFVFLVCVHLCLWTR